MRSRDFEEGEKEVQISTTVKPIQRLDFHSTKEFGGPSQHQHNEEISVPPHHYLQVS